MADVRGLWKGLVRWRARRSEFWRLDTETRVSQLKVAAHESSNYSEKNQPHAGGRRDGGNHRVLSECARIRSHLEIAGVRNCGTRWSEHPLHDGCIGRGHEVCSRSYRDLRRGGGDPSAVGACEDI